ncbi:uncharacterized protein MYCGRDRAFT_97557 [Zymoseptoria tritici IPO323]|uniref:Uncharacterized protein n=1 Tax=Zymoseptoria tritici (strain CBS 115943 / IPO323) TaxID=336722 RepID=F9XQL5_ZYMTI|nr:uncharacterized protein MYCGRDRAFT_97557 [Zymoseptoria tritici IPO323]EGP82382.1 hypothetical protein MYCGRDRAFT_97557 [Zymoseptoria tritici IPO323]
MTGKLKAIPEARFSAIQIASPRSLATKSQKHHMSTMTTIQYMPFFDTQASSPRIRDANERHRLPRTASHARYSTPTFTYIHCHAHQHATAKLPDDDCFGYQSIPVPAYHKRNPHPMLHRQLHVLRSFLHYSSLTLSSDDMASDHASQASIQSSCPMSASRKMRVWHALSVGVLRHKRHCGPRAVVSSGVELRQGRESQRNGWCRTGEARYFRQVMKLDVFGEAIDMVRKKKPKNEHNKKTTTRKEVEEDVNIQDKTNDFLISRTTMRVMCTPSVQREPIEPRADSRSSRARVTSTGSSAMDSARHA